MKAVSDAPHRFEEELGREVAAGTGDKGALVPRGGDVARATDALAGCGWVLEPLPWLCSSRCCLDAFVRDQELGLPGRWQNMC